MINGLHIIALCPTDSEINDYFLKTDWELQQQSEEFKVFFMTDQYCFF